MKNKVVTVFDFFHGVERDALDAMLKQIAPQICDPNCKPYLAIGKKYTTEASFEGAWVTIHLYPCLCDTIEEGEAWARGYEGGCMVDAKELRKEYYRCFSKRGTCYHCHRDDDGAIICDLGHEHKYANKRGCPYAEF